MFNIFKKYLEPLFVLQQTALKEGNAWNAIFGQNGQLSPSKQLKISYFESMTQSLTTNIFSCFQPLRIFLRDNIIQSPKSFFKFLSKQNPQSPWYFSADSLCLGGKLFPKTSDFVYQIQDLGASSPPQSRQGRVHTVKLVTVPEIPPANTNLQNSFVKRYQ